MSHLKMSAWERIECFLDNQSFVEIGSLMEARNTDYNLGAKKAPGDGVITGYGVRNGRMVCIFSQDSAVLGGSVGEMHANKIMRLYDVAMNMGAPVIGMMDSAGLRLQEGGDALHAFGKIFKKQAQASGVIPQICAVFGKCGGGSALMAAMADFTFMEKEHGALFIHSPNVLEGNSADRQNTAGWEYQSREAGSVDFVCGTEEEMIKQMQKLTDILPSDYEAEDDVFEEGDDLNRIIPELETAQYDAKFILSSVSDNGYFLETKEMYAKDMVTAFIRLNGETVGCVANQPTGDKRLLTAEGLKKAEGFVKFCDAFSYPILTVANVNGMEFCEKAERELGRALAGFTAALAKGTVPKVNLIAGEAYGTAGTVMNSQAVGADFVLAWKGSSFGMMDAEQAVRIMYAEEISAGKEQLALIAGKAKEYRETQNSILSAAKRGYVDDIIEPDATRKRLIAAFEMLYGKKRAENSGKYRTI